jgi:hypothetical protein
MTRTTRLTRGTTRPLLATVAALAALLGVAHRAGADSIVATELALPVLQASPVPLLFALPEPSNPADRELYDLSIPGALWAPASQGFVNLIDLPGPIEIGDRAVFENLGGVAHLLFGSDNESSMLPSQVLDIAGLPLLGNFVEGALTVPTVPIPLDLISANGGVVPVAVTLFSDPFEAPGSLSDTFTVQAVVPEPAGMALFGLGILWVAGVAWRRRKRAAT